MGEKNHVCSATQEGRGSVEEGYIFIEAERTGDSCSAFELCQKVNGVRTLEAKPPELADEFFHRWIL